MAGRVPGKALVTERGGVAPQHRPVCSTCKVECDAGTEIILRAVQDGVVIEDKVYCCRPCFLDGVESELTDSRVESAKRDEIRFLHDNICPACKRRLRDMISDDEDVDT